MARQHGRIVRNALIVTMSLIVPMVVARADTGPDSWTRIRAQAALQSVEGVRLSEIRVDSINGRVTLRGTVRTAKIRADAAEDVGRLAGVVQVRNLIRVVPSDGNVGVRRSDNAIRADVQRVLNADRSLHDSHIQVTSVRTGIVLLSGIAASTTDGLRALHLAANRPGVRLVRSQIETRNEVAVRSGTTQVGAPIVAISSVRHDPVEAEDDVIRRGVTNALDDLDVRDNADIRVMVKDRVVWLSGTVPTWEGNSSRMHAARSVTGVRSIMNGVRVVAPYGGTP